MRIVSLVPNATEILFALGAGELVVGVSHECDHPPEAKRRPVLTGSALPAALPSAAVDAAVSAQLASGASLYTLDEAAIAALAPDLVFTQELCPVCAVSTAQVDGALAPIPRCPEVVSLDPTRLEDVLADILRVGARVGRERAAAELVAALRARLERIECATHGRPRLTVVALEWLDPPFLGGHWVPQMIAVAGGRDPFAVQPGERSRRASWEEIAAADPDWIVAMPCGFDEAGAAREVEKLADVAAWRALRAVRAGRVAAVDANGCFSRPGPRLVDGVERLHELLTAARPAEERRARALREI
jgi:iron complex transport system substrate-binding protein